MSTAIPLKKRIWGWMAFDWATQPFYTLGLTFIFGPYFAAVAAEYYLGTGLDEQTADAQAQSLWSLGQSAAGFFIAFSAPILGAYADSTGRRLPWMVLFSITYVIAMSLLWYMVPDGSAIWFCLIAFNVGFIATEFGLIFTNAILPSLGSRQEIGRISGNGLAFGYWGGVLSLVIMLVFFFELNEGKTLLGLSPPFGLDPEMREGTRIVGPFIALWFMIFMIPYFMWVREGKANKTGGLIQALRDLGRTLSLLPKRPSLFAYLGSSMLYRDALNALYAFGGVYAALVLDWGMIQIATFGVIAAIAAAVATQISGRCDERFGPRPVIVFHVLTLTLVCLVIVGMSREAFFGIPLPAGSILPDTVFYICGAVIGGAGGGLYGASRSMMVRHTNPDRPTEAFGLFALSGKATAFLAPLLIGIFTYTLNDARLGFTPVIGLFILGLILLKWVNKDGDQDA